MGNKQACVDHEKAYKTLEKSINDYYAIPSDNNKDNIVSSLLNINSISGFNLLLINAISKNNDKVVKLLLDKMVHLITMEIENPIKESTKTNKIYLDILESIRKLYPDLLDTTNDYITAQIKQDKIWNKSIEKLKYGNLRRKRTSKISTARNGRFKNRKSVRRTSVCNKRN